MKYKPLYIMAFCVLVVPSLVRANEVVQWVDENGVTHFSDAKYVPAGQGDVVRINPANSMDSVDTAVLSKRTVRSGPRLTVLEQKHVSNPRGFRGFAGRTSAKSSRHHNFRR